MFRKFYPDAQDHLVNRFIEKAVELDKNLSPAAVQGHFMFYKVEPEDAIKNLHRLK